ncbi:MAG: SprB repeat-containing protein [Chitinophagales bacterium]
MLFVISLNASISTFQNISCFGANDGTVSVTVTGATGAISYNWSDQGFNSTISTRNNLTPGSKTVTVSDASGCSVTLSFTIVEPAQLTATLVSTTDASCNGTNTGSVDMTVSGGTGTPTYSWTNTTQNTVDLTGVGAGSYTLTYGMLTDVQMLKSATINEPNAISVVVDNTVMFLATWVMMEL